jgi:hypothetical protein
MIKSLEGPTYLFRAERQFGLIVGGIFGLLGGWWVFKGKFEVLAFILLTLGIVLLSLGAVFPRALVLPRRWWMLLAVAISFVTTPIILAILFFLVVSPIGLIKRLTGWDPLGRRAASAPSYWKNYSARRDPRHYERMY